MTNTIENLCTVAAPGVKVLTRPIGTGWESVILGGPLDGETFVSDGDPEQQHASACVLARMSE